MPLRAIRDTFAMEPIYGVEVRRQVKAGTLVPPHYTIVDPQDVEEIAGANFILGGGTHPPQIRPDMSMPPAAPPDYSAMTLPELKEAATDRGIMVTPDAKKADILAALEGK